MICAKQVWVLSFAILAVSAAPAQTLAPSHKSSVKEVSVSSSNTSGKAVARVNGVAISQSAFDQEQKRIFPYYSMHGNAIPKEYEAQVRQKALNNLINTELVYQEAKRRNLQITPLEWQKRLAEIRKDYRSTAEFDSAIHQYFGSKEAFEATLRHDMLLDKIYVLEVKRKAVVTDVEVSKEYETHKASYTVPESVSFQTISAMFPERATPADKQVARKRIEGWLSQAQNAKNVEAFGVLAERVSEDEYRVMMGEHKMVHVATVAPEFKSVLKMKEGEITGIIESPVGYHIVRLNKRNPSRKMTFAQVRADIKKSMQKERLDARNNEFQSKLRKAAKVEVL
jgi:parvulin-like peptidyl-prolyl isomerase